MALVASKSQQGLSLVIAVFILVALALLGAAMINILAGGTASVAREVISTRALFAAESGAQRKLNEIFYASGSVTPGQCTPTTYTGVSAFGGLFGCGDVSVDCSYVTIDITNYYTITSTGSCGPADAPAVRAVLVQAKDDI